MRRSDVSPAASLSKDRRGTCARRATPYLPGCCLTSFLRPTGGTLQWGIGQRWSRGTSFSWRQWSTFQERSNNPTRAACRNAAMTQPSFSLASAAKSSALTRLSARSVPVRTSASMAATESASADCRRTENRASASLALRLFMVELLAKTLGYLRDSAGPHRTEVLRPLRWSLRANQYVGLLNRLNQRATIRG